jgi:hypothetical protein
MNCYKSAFATRDGRAGSRGKTKSRASCLSQRRPLMCRHRKGDIGSSNNDGGNKTHSGHCGHTQRVAWIPDPDPIFLKYPTLSLF